MIFEFRELLTIPDIIENGVMCRDALTPQRFIVFEQILAVYHQYEILPGKRNGL
jgi:hypothetical protein